MNHKYHYRPTESGIHKEIQFEENPLHFSRERVGVWVKKIFKVMHVFT